MQHVGERLIEHGFEPERPSFCSVLGVTQYLGRDSVEALFGFASTLKKGSEIVFSFVLPDDELSGDDLHLVAGGVARSEAMGEPWITRLGPRELAEQLVRLGFSEVFHLTPELAQQRYFAGRQDGLRAPRWEQLVAAIV